MTVPLKVQPKLRFLLRSDVATKISKHWIEKKTQFVLHSQWTYLRISVMSLMLAVL